MGGHLQAAVKSVEEKVSIIDWDFKGALSNYGLHRFHWYPGTFIPQLPGYLIELFSQPGDVVYDPFCGVGTTLVEALRLGRRAVGIDQNFIATLVSSAKTTFFEHDDLDRSTKYFLDDLSIELERVGLVKEFSLAKYSPTEMLGRAEIELQDVGAWYEERTFRELLVLWLTIQKQNLPLRTLLQVTFSSILKRCSSQPKHWGYVADNMIPDATTRYYVDAIKLFTVSLHEFAAALNSFREFPQIRGVDVAQLNNRASVIRADLAIGSPLHNLAADLIVTSPPYVNVTDYTRSQRLSLPWFRKQVDLDKHNEVGARWKRGRKSAVEDYLKQMNLCFDSLAAALKPGKFLCMVIGESEDLKAKYAIIAKLTAMLSNKGFRAALEPVVRVPSQQRLKSRKGNTNEEYIYIFRKS